MIKAILAVDDEGGIGKDGTLPWPKNSTDMKWFKDNTSGHVVVMGSTTWSAAGMPKPLPNRCNVVASFRPESEFEKAHHVIPGPDLIAGVKDIEDQYPGLIVWIIGGAAIIKETLPIIDEFYLTRIDGTYDCDTFLDMKLIESMFEVEMTIDDNGTTFEILTRRSKEIT